MNGALNRTTFAMCDANNVLIDRFHFDDVSFDFYINHH